MKDAELLGSVKRLRGKEKELICEIIERIAVIEQRALYRDAGYSSMFDYMTRGLNYSEGAACRRMRVARSMKSTPEIFQALKNEEISLCVADNLARAATKENAPELLSKSVGKTKAEVQELVAELKAPLVAARPKATVRKTSVKRVKVKQAEAPLFSPPTSTATVTVESPKYSVSLQVDQDFMKLFEQAALLCGKKDMTEVFEALLSEYIERKCPKKRQERREARKESKPVESNNPRYIPAAVRDEVYIRDEGQCTYVSPDGVRCSCKRNLEVDHIHPVALGGGGSSDNLRLLCSAHNQLAAERIFGREFMEQRRGVGG